MTKRPTLTDLQRRVFDYLYDYTMAHGYQPIGRFPPREAEKYPD